MSEFDSIRLIVGLGNPGARYFSTRHNAGQWWVKALAKQYHAHLSSSRCDGVVASIAVSDGAAHLFLPTTYMNCSGKAVQQALKFYKIQAKQMLVVHDELDFASGTLRLKLGGGHGGHNGLRDIISLLGSADFLRLRIGIGHPGNAYQVANYVLSPPPEEEKKIIDAEIINSLVMVPSLLSGELANAMHLLHS